jgi:tetratricopeptide (TPR) repeat protein
MKIKTTELKATILMILLTGFIFYNPLIAEENIVLGKVIRIQGKVIAENLKTGKTHILKMNDNVYRGAKIKAQEDSYALLSLKNNVLKYVPADSEVVFLSREDWEVYRRTNPGVDKMTVLVGTKAEKEENVWLDEETLLREAVEEKFRKGEFFEIIRELEGSKKSIKSREMLYMAAVSYLKVGYEKESIRYFKELLKLEIYEYKKAAYLGLFLSYLRSGNKEMAKSVIETVARQYPETPVYQEMKEMMGS